MCTEIFCPNVMVPKCSVPYYVEQREEKMENKVAYTEENERSATNSPKTAIKKKNVAKLFDIGSAE